MARVPVAKRGSLGRKTSFSNTIQKKANTNQILIENFVSLQRVMTNLSSKFDDLSLQISKLLELFEISAKTLAKNDSFHNESGNNKEVMEKLDNLIDQNKIIARGLTLMHEMNPRESQEEPIRRSIQERPLMRRPMLNTQRQMSPKTFERSHTENNKYQESIPPRDESKI